MFASENGRAMPLTHFWIPIARTWEREATPAAELSIAAENKHREVLLKLMRLSIKLHINTGVMLLNQTNMAAAKIVAICANNLHITFPTEDTSRPNATFAELVR